MENRLPRKLAAILYADVVGYSRLTGDDEDATHRALTDSLDLISVTIQSHHGKVMHYAGDAVLAMFEAVVDAVTCAVDAQEQLHSRNSELPDLRKVQFRIGINLGDIIEDRGDIYGDGVNVAARLESIAAPGGVCVSAAVFDQINGKLDLHFEDMGERELKNIAEKITAYRITPEPAPFPPESFESLTGELLYLPDKPSIAVLPFQNMTGDSSQEHLADGMSEDIITVLSRVPDLVVIARNSTFVYKGRAIDVRQVGSDLGVGYVLEGSIRKTGDRLRVTAQLNDSLGGGHIWAERYDRNLDDIFAIQDEITREIVIALSVKLTYGEESRVWSGHTSSFEVWDLLQRGLTEQLKFTKEGNDEAQRIARRACKLDPDFYIPKLLLGWVLQIAARYGFVKDRAAAVLEAESLAKEVLAEDEQNGDAHALLCFIMTNQLKIDKGIVHGEQAIELGPSCATHHAGLAVSLFYAGKHEASLARMKKAMRLSPYAPDWFLGFLGDMYRSLGKLEKAREVYEHLEVRLPSSQLSLTRLACIYSDLGDAALARDIAHKLVSINPEFSVSNYVDLHPFKLDTDRESITKALLNAGLPA